MPKTPKINLRVNPSAIKQSRKIFRPFRGNNFPSKSTNSARTGTAGNMKFSRNASAKSNRKTASHARVSPHPGHGMPVNDKNGQPQPNA